MSTATFVRNARRQRCQQVKSLQGPGSVFLCKSDSLPVPCWPPCAHFLASLHPTFPAPGEVCAQSIKTDPGPWSFSRTPWWLGGMWSAAAHLEEERDLKITDIIIGFQA